MALIIDTEAIDCCKEYVHKTNDYSYENFIFNNLQLLNNKNRTPEELQRIFKRTVDLKRVEDGEISWEELYPPEFVEKMKQLNKSIIKQLDSIALPSSLPYESESFNFHVNPARKTSEINIVVNIGNVDGSSIIVGSNNKISHTPTRIKPNFSL